MTSTKHTHSSPSQRTEESSNLSVLATAAMLQSRTTQGEPDCDLSTPNTDDVIDILDSEEEKESEARSKTKTRTKTKTKPSSGKKSEKEPIGNPTTFELLVPTPQGSSRVLTIPFNSDFDSGQAKIYQAIGCDNVTRKPNLSYKLTPCAKAICLKDEDSWNSLCTAVMTKFTKNKGKKILQIKIVIPVPYMDAMIKHLAPKAKSNGAKKKGRPSAHTVLDLDHAFGNKLDNDAGDGAAAMEDKNKALDRLEKKYKGKCESCSKTSPDIWCKINRDSKHAHLTFHQCQAWAVALVQKNHGVTYDATPNMDLFSRFHFKVPAPAPPATPVSSSVFGLVALAMAGSRRTGAAIMASLLAPSCMHPQLPTLQLSPARRQDGGNFYIFMQEIDSLHPMHRLSRFIDTLADKEEYLIVRDLRDLGAEYLISSVHIPSATVNWLISMARACVNGTPLPQT
ncbi:hypothetical protein DFH08DRAFT_824582 [Mycena albidolilacea]|uniref:Uncharacterized protein n=1 Tax=Mycena albidolilacea TaxID=1033008 RepID=A0AAD7EB04_9AGAR|nr:hypothetical protein DFH08DRAFT_824582 [Mycena albidolilacea]